MLMCLNFAHKWYPQDPHPTWPISWFPPTQLVGPFMGGDTRP